MRIALAGDTMLGRGVAERLATVPPQALVSPDVVDVVRGADLFLLNLECCISARGRRWRAAGKPFFFRAPPAAVDFLRLLDVDCVCLANNHALDFGRDALLDTFDYLRAAGIAWVGAGRDLDSARRPALLDGGGTRVAVVAATDHPEDFAAAARTPGVAFADLRRRGIPEWLGATVAGDGADLRVATCHWGPNMNPEPLDYVRRAAEELVASGADLVAGHSAHVFQGARPPVLYDLGDFIDDYATNPVLRNDLGLLWLVEFGGCGAPRVEAVPLKLDYCHTRLAEGHDAAWIRRRFHDLCARLGATVEEVHGRLVVGGARGPKGET